MNNDLIILAITAASIGFLHTLLGPDHYLPFIMIGKARNWSLKKLIFVSALCGFGHVAGSIILGVFGITIGIAIKKITAVESLRGELAAWAFISFGLIYLIWGIRKAIKNKPHSHIHLHEEDGWHEHEHSHKGDHTHIHDTGKSNITPWVLFIIFVLGPCEPLIPILMYPAAQQNTSSLIIITLIFALVTVGTMLGLIIFAYYGFRFIPLRKLERYSHALAGFIIMFSGLGIKFLGL